MSAQLALPFARGRVRRDIALRAATLVLAWIHTFPAGRHLSAFFAEPSWSEAWKGFGGAMAVLLYLQSPSLQARLVVGLWRAGRHPVALAGWLLVLVHAVPAADHLPKLAANLSWADGWRGIGSFVACLWFALPVPGQARVVSRVTRLARAGFVAQRDARA